MTTLSSVAASQVWSDCPRFSFLGHLSNHVPDTQIPSLVEHHRELPPPPPQTRAMQSNCYTRTYDLSNNSIWCPAFRSLIKKCFWKIVKRVPISWTRTASSNSNARTSMNESAFNLKITNHSSGYPLTLEMETYSTRENLYAIHPCDPPRNISMLPHTPGISAGISFNQNTEYTYFNSRVSFPIMPPTD